MVSVRSTALVAVSAFAMASAGHIHPNVHRELQQTNDAADVVVVFKKNNLEALEALETNEVLDRGERISNMIQHLDASNKQTQSEVFKVLSQEAEGVAVKEVTRLWITSSLFVKGASRGFIERVSQLDSVAEVRLPYVASIELPEVEPINDVDFIPVPEPEWGLKMVQAPQVWQAGFSGQNVVVANIDTGVRVTHEALRHNYVGEYGWFDPENNATEPYDAKGHGTHTMGTMVGQNGIGVAPGAKWMACKACRAQGCPEEDLLKCAQFLTCPTDTQGKNPNCKKAPNVINNSWSGGQGDLWYAEAVQAWLKAGIMPVFSMGNTGPACSTAKSPGDYPNVIGVGATALNDSITTFSSKGPSVKGVMKPDISAPGHRVRSSVPESDASYGLKSGTSMATPHVAGIIALMLSANPNATYDQIKQDLFSTVDTKTLLKSNFTCGNVAEDVFPNNVYGYGRANAYQAVFGKTPAPTTPKPTVTVPPTPAPTPKRGLCFNIKQKVWCNLTILCHWVDNSYCASRF